MSGYQIKESPACKPLSSLETSSGRTPLKGRKTTKILNVAKPSIPFYALESLTIVVASDKKVNFHFRLTERE